LDPEVVCWLMVYVALCTTSMTQGLARAWAELRSRGLTRRAGVSEEAFCQARAALPWRYFRQLLEGLIRRYQGRFDAAMRWKGRWRLLAADSTLVDLPRSASLRAFFGVPRSQHGVARIPQLRLTTLCSVLTGFCLGMVATPLHLGEPAAARHLLRRLRRDDLVLLDRNFFGYAIILAARRRSAHVVVRLQARFAAVCRSVKRLGIDDGLVELRPDKLARRRTPGLPRSLTLRLVRYQRPGFRPSWLLTTLTDPAEVTAAELVDLYHMRWSIETVYRELKHALDIQNLRSATPRGVLKEVQIQVILHNLVRWVMTEAAAKARCIPVALSFTTALSLVRAAAFTLPHLSNRQRRRAHRRLLEAIGSSAVRQRPGRSYPRPCDRPRNKGRGRFTLPARITSHA
jgi:hypothetical protein